MWWQPTSERNIWASNGLSNTQLPTINAHSSGQPSQQSATFLAFGEMVTLQTATTLVQSPVNNQSTSARLFLDCGSQRSYITEALAQQLRLKSQASQMLSVYTFGSKEQQQIKTSVVTVRIKLINGSSFDLSVNVVPTIMGDLKRMPVNLDQYVDLIRQLPLADSIPAQPESLNAQLLVGHDYYWNLITSEKIQLSEGLFLIGSKLGWILSGRYIPSPKQQWSPTMVMATAVFSSTTDHLSFLEEDQPIKEKLDIKRLWDLDTIGIKEPINDSEDELALQIFNNSIQYQDNRYYVKWPWKGNQGDLPTNYQLALGRLKSMIRRLQTDPALASQYHEIIQQQEQKGIIERVQDFHCKPNSFTNIASQTVYTQKHYIPHHAVITPDKMTTKVRIVYDGSAKASKSNLSINDCMFRGPVILEDVCHLLMRFRLNPVALVGDIEKAFLQVGLQPQERDVTRFLWLKEPTKLTTENNIQIYRFTRVPFGIISSPFLLGATIAYHMRKDGSPIAQNIINNIYVDNLITGTTSVDDAKTFFVKTKELFNSASMNIREWASNSQEFLSSIPESDRVTKTKLQILGISWNTITDTLSLTTSFKSDSDTLTKRSILKYLASVFDPLGLFCPTILTGKLLLQKLWKNKIGWDDILPNDIVQEWKNIESDINPVTKISIPRFLGVVIRNPTYELHCFCDASQLAYGTAIYLRIIHQQTAKVQLIFAKSRLAPVQTLTLPRLELLAVQIGVTSMKFVANGLSFSTDKQFLWTDSQCVLHWLHSNKPLTVFVKNRVNNIKKHNDIAFRYVPTHCNPADIASRGIKATDLATSPLWWHGPQWLSNVDQFSWPSQDFLATTDDSKTRSEILFSTSASTSADAVEPLPPFGIDYSKYSSLTKLLRTTAWALQFVHQLKIKSKSLESTNVKKPATSAVLQDDSTLSAEQIASAKHMWIRYIQQKHYADVINAVQNNKKHPIQMQFDLWVDQNGILRCGGRLSNADLPELARYPILLPKKDQFTTLIIETYHKKLFHVGVSQTLSQIRQEYWIPAGRSVVFHTIRSCVNCKKFDGGPYKLPPMPPLPATRGTPSAAFRNTGLDYLGPLFIKSPDNTLTKKAWICLFTCLATRAVHLEVVEDMSAAQFLMCIQRFIARRGKPDMIISDNALQFKLVQSTMEQLWKQCLTDPVVVSHASNQGIKWQYIVERAPWHGGFYERLVRLIKQCLRKTLGKIRLTLIQLQTVVTEVEAIINTRPLTYVGSDFGGGEMLTPAHFLSLNPKISLPFAITDDQLTDPDYIAKQSTKTNLLATWKKGQRHLDHFWNLWKNDYLLNLRERSQQTVKQPYCRSSSIPEVGDIIHIADDGPRGSWKLAKLIKLYPSSDSQIRSADVLTSSGVILKRSLAHLYPLELHTTPTQFTNRVKGSKPQDSSPQEPSGLTARPVRQAAIKAKSLIKSQMEAEAVATTTSAPELKAPQADQVRHRIKYSPENRDRNFILTISIIFSFILGGLIKPVNGLSPLICEAEAAKLAIDLSINHRCNIRNPTEEEKPKEVTISLYKRNIAKAASPAWTCSKTETTLSAWTQFAKTGWDKAMFTRNLPVSEEECNAMISTDKCSAGRLFGGEDLAYTENHADYPFSSGNAWDCCRWINASFINCNRVKGKVYHTFGGQMESNLGNVGHCDYEKEHCTLSNNAIIIWKKAPASQCEYVFWRKMDGYLWLSGKFINKEKTFALTWDPEKVNNIKLCNNETAGWTDQGIPISWKWKKQKEKRQAEPLEPMLQAMDIRLAKFFNQDLASRFFELCKLLELMQDLDLIFAHQEPTLIARRLLQDDHVMARLNGKILDVWSCIPVDSFKTLPMNHPNCYNALPMNFSLKGQTNMGYYDTKTRIIFNKAEPIDCHLTEELHYNDENQGIMVYQGSTGFIRPFNGTILKHPLYYMNFSLFADFKEVLHKPMVMYHLDEIRAQTSLNDLYDSISKHEKILRELSEFGPSKPPTTEVQKIVDSIQKWTPLGFIPILIQQAKEIWIYCCCTIVTLCFFWKCLLPQYVQTIASQHYQRAQLQYQRWRNPLVRSDNSSGGMELEPQRLPD